MRVPVWTLAFALLAAATPAVAQFPPDSLVNVKVIPKGTPVRQVIGMMRGFALGLGVRCEYCHVGEAGQPLSTFDFPKDEKPTKEKARVMLQMVQDINKDYLERLRDRGTPHVEVQCVTCHRGLSRPRMLEDVIAQVADSAGGAAAVARYRELRKEYYGTFSYDFSEDVLNGTAQILLRGNKPADAVAILDLNTEFYPESFLTQVGYANAYRALGDTAKAIAALEHALKIQPEAQQVRRLLEQWKGNR